MNQKKIVESIASKPHMVTFVKAMNYIPTVIMYVAFAAVLLLAFRKSAVLMLEIAVICAVPFFVISFLRAKINAPRPEEIYGFSPIVPCRPGNSFPSRHALSAALIATVSFRISVIIGIFLSFIAIVLCVFRYVAGVHRLRDLVFGLFFGVIFGVVGLCVLYSFNAI
ncbi:MAG: phosphatase PAP2 family protein [Eubacteriales bacterium]|nr:phosphatase PAP2 family protein [Eubacteriales bacterium]